MKQDIKIIGLDLDGTTLQHYTGISPRVRASIQRAIQNGVVVLPATGRQLGGIPQEFLSIPGVRYALTSNGAKIYDLAENEEVYSDCFTPAETIDLLDFLAGFEAVMSVYIDGRGYAAPNGQVEKKLNDELVAYMHATRTQVPSLAAFVQKAARPVEKIPLHFVKEEERQRAWRALDARGDVSITSSMPLNMEVNTKTANKGAGLLALGRLLGAQRSQIMAVGDGLNDVEMLRQVGWGVAMGNALPQVKAVADAVTESCQNDGVADAIDRVLGF